MSSNIGGAPAPEQQVAPEPSAAPPAPEAGLPQPPSLEPPQAQIPQPPAAPRVDPDEAVAFFERFARPDTRGTQFLDTGRQYGFVPEGIDSADEMAQALQFYAEWKRAQAQEPVQPQVDPGLQQPPVHSQPQQELPAAPGAEFGVPHMPPASLDPDEIAQRVLTQLEQREQQQRIQREQETKLENLQTAVATATQGMSPAAQQMVLQNVALGIDQAVAQGKNPDFSVERLTEYAVQVMDAMRGIGAVEQQTQTQQQIAAHRAMAPRTVVPTGAPASGAPQQGPRGMEGVKARIRAAQLAQQGGG